MNIIKSGFGFFLATLLAGCGGSESGPSEITSFTNLQAISFETNTYTLIVGNSETLEASGGSGTGALSYESTDEAVVSVTQSGVITANSVGTATITATKAADNLYSAASATVAITVTPKIEQNIAFPSDTYSVIITNQITITPTGGEGDGAVSFSSSDDSIVTVSSDGVVTGISLGTVTVTATKAEDSTFAEATAQTSVTVTPKLAQSITFGEQSYTVVLGNSQSVTASGGPGIGQISYVSSDSSIATVNSAGLVTGVAIGSVTITAFKAADSTYEEASATTTVNVSGLLQQTIGFSSSAYTLTVNDSQTITATGGEGTGQITYSSADESVVTISATGLVTAVNVGSTTITAVKAADTLYAETFVTASVTVEPAVPDAPVISVVWTGNGRLTLGWADVTDATSYSLFYATESIAALDDLANLESLDGAVTVLDVTSDYTLAGLENNTPYFLVVTALTGSVESPISNELVSTPMNPLNDTGITVSGNGTSGINATCTKAIQNGGHVPQDCDQGRDADTTIAANKAGTGVAAFDYTKLGSDGSAIPVQNGTWSATGTEADGTLWSCVRDNVTGLIWEVKTTTGTHSFNVKGTWQNRNTLADTTNTEGLCGITDWRVPSLTELLTIVNNGRQNPAFDVPRFPNGKSQSYWTSDPISGVATNAWTVNFFAGIGNSKAKTSNFQVRLVSGAYAASKFDAARFVDNGDGTLSDVVTGLMWKRCPEGLSGEDCSNGSASTLVWGGSMKAARDSTYAGYDDWRLPNMKEMQTLVDVTKNNPAQDTSVFPNPTNVLNYWTSSLTKKANPVTQSYRINFQRGLSEFVARTGSQNAQWLVRDDI